MNIYKNFLNKKEFKKTKSIMMGPHFPWYFFNGVNLKNDGFCQFGFVFLDEKGINCAPQFMNLLQPILSRLKYKKLRAVKANLLTQTPQTIEHGMHTDQPAGTTCIFYINKCNGYTKFKNGKKIKSEENKLIEFNSQLEHTGSSCTDETRRVVINFNYV
jgi:hypothetical protein